MTSVNPKIVSLDQLELIVGNLRQKGLKVVMCHGVFDLLHPGHITHLRQARALGDRLVVTLTPDRHVNKGPGRPVFRESLRLETLAALESVDFVALNNWPTAIETIRKIKPDLYVKGKEYEDFSSDVTGMIEAEAEAVKSAGGQIVFTDGETFSSSHLINRYLSTYPPETDLFLKGFRDRHAADAIISSIRLFSDLKVLVVGEAIIDQYCYCTTLGKSPKETIVATKFVAEEQFAGGALATANHVAGFCGRATLLTSLGTSADDHDFVMQKMLPNVTTIPIAVPDRPTVTKRRYVEPNYMTKMFEVQYLDDTPVSPVVERRVLDQLDAEIPRHDLVIVNDFGHGFLTDAVRRRLCEKAPFLALNTQSNSANMGFNPVTKYPRADYVCLDDPELRFAAGRRHGKTEVLVEPLKKRMGAAVFTVSLGANGVVVLNDHQSADRVPVMTTRVVDRTGAGDALFAVTSLCVFRKFHPEVVGFVGNCVGALAVETVCNREPVQPSRLYPFIRALLK